ncbi:MAG: hypothetical protein ACE5H0_00740 [Bacteroidota bacterium]
MHSLVEFLQGQEMYIVGLVVVAIFLPLERCLKRLPKPVEHICNGNQHL